MTSNLIAPQSAEAADVVSALYRNACLSADAASAYLWVHDAYSDTLRLISAVAEPFAGHLPRQAKAEGLGDVLARGKALLLESGTADCGGLAWTYAFPVNAGETRGVAGIDLRCPGRPDGRPLNALASAFKLPLSSALALHAAQSKMTIARALVEANDTLMQAPNEKSVADQALQTAMRLTQATTGSVMLLDERGERMRIVSAAGLPEDVVATTEVAEGEGIAGWVLSAGQGVVVEDLDEAHQGPNARRHGVRSAMSIPISDGAKKLGVLNVGSRQFGSEFLPGHIAALETLGRLAGVALRTAKNLASAQEMWLETVKAVVLALESKGSYQSGGLEKVDDLATRVAVSLGLPESEVRSLRIAAMLRDIGMSAAGSAIASNQPLSTIEWGLLKLHPAIAGEAIARIPALKPIEPLVLHHHERYDGSGYTEGLAGEQIPLGSRILAVADAYVAMRSDRPYRPKLSAEEARAEVRAQSGKQFDPKVVDALMRVLELEQT